MMPTVTLGDLDAREYFVGVLSIVVFMLLLLCYAVQTGIALSRARLPREFRVEETTKSISVRQAVKCFDDGYRNVWTLLILVVFVPVFLTAVGDIIPIISLTTYFAVRAHLGAVAYYVCYAIIGVLITLEFSYVYNLRKSAPDWISMLIVALALDVSTLLTLNIFIRNPHVWDGINTGTGAAMTATTLLAATSTSIILVCARTAGAISELPPNELRSLIADIEEGEKDQDQNEEEQGDKDEIPPNEERENLSDASTKS